MASEGRHDQSSQTSTVMTRGGREKGEKNRVERQRGKKVKLREDEQRRRAGVGQEDFSAP